VEEGVDAVMTAHVAVPGVLGPDGPPATLSPFFLTELLREDMGFEGLLLTDAIRMQAIAQGYGVGESAILALEAGADILLAPADIWETLRAVEEAVRSGRISRERLDASVRRILKMKARAGLHRHRKVNLDRISEVVASREHLAMADSAATRAITLPRDRDGLLPLDPRDYSRVLHVVYARGADLTAGRTLGAALGEFFPTVVTRRLTPESPSTAYQELSWIRDGPGPGQGTSPFPGSCPVSWRRAWTGGPRRSSPWGTPTSSRPFPMWGPMSWAGGPTRCRRRRWPGLWWEKPPSPADSPSPSLPSTGWERG
jgi:hypothetical protein